MSDRRPPLSTPFPNAGGRNKSNTALFAVPEDREILRTPSENQGAGYVFGQSSVPYPASESPSLSFAVPSQLQTTPQTAISGEQTSFITMRDGAKPINTANQDTRNNEAEDRTQAQPRHEMFTGFVFGASHAAEDCPTFQPEIDTLQPAVLPYQSQPMDGVRSAFSLASEGLGMGFGNSSSGVQAPMFTAGTNNNLGCKPWNQATSSAPNVWTSSNPSTNFATSQPDRMEASPLTDTTMESIISSRVDLMETDSREKRSTIRSSAQRGSQAFRPSSSNPTATLPPVVERVRQEEILESPPRTRRTNPSDEKEGKYKSPPSRGSKSGTPRSENSDTFQRTSSNQQEIKFTVDLGGSDSPIRSPDTRARNSAGSGLESARGSLDASPRTPSPSSSSSESGQYVSTARKCIPSLDKESDTNNPGYNTSIITPSVIERAKKISEVISQPWDLSSPVRAQKDYSSQPNPLDDDYPVSTVKMVNDRIGREIRKRVDHYRFLKEFSESRRKFLKKQEEENERNRTEDTRNWDAFVQKWKTERQKLETELTRLFGLTIADIHEMQPVPYKDPKYSTYPSAAILKEMTEINGPEALTDLRYFTIFHKEYGKINFGISINVKNFDLNSELEFQKGKLIIKKLERLGNTPCRLTLYNFYVPALFDCYETSKEFLETCCEEIGFGVCLEEYSREEKDEPEWCTEDDVLLNVIS